MHSNLVEINSCPWCDSREKRPIDNVSTRNNNYLIALEATAEIPPGDMAKVDTYQCLECDTIYLATFFDDKIVAKTFLTETSGHNHGWRSFHAKTGLLPKKAIAQSTRESQIKRIILNSISGIDGVYAEVGCPFSGLIHEMLCDDQDRDIIKHRYFSFLLDTIKKNEAAFFSFCKLSSSLTSVFGYLFAASLRYKLGRLSRSVRKDAALPQRKRTNEIYLIKPESRFIWGSNCTSNFATCVATSISVYGINQLRLSELATAANGRHITIGFFNTLDHQENARAMLEESMDIADNVIIETHGHKAGGGRQHLFFLNETIPAWSQKKGWGFQNLTPKIVAQAPGYKNFLFALKKS